MHKIFGLIAILICTSGSLTAAEPETVVNGWVKLSFDIDEQGRPQNIVVTDSHPEGHFDEEAIKALSSWKYKPKLVDGKPVVQQDMFVKLDFTLEDES